MRIRVPACGADLRMQPLRIPAGWHVTWNTLYVPAPGEEADFGGSSIFHAVNEGRRFVIDVMFRPEFDPDGPFHLAVTYQPWPRTERGRRRTAVPLRIGEDAESVHDFETRSFQELVAELESGIGRCSGWQREGH